MQATDTPPQTPPLPHRNQTRDHRRAATTALPVPPPCDNCPACDRGRAFPVGWEAHGDCLRCEYRCPRCDRPWFTGWSIQALRGSA